MLHFNYKPLMNNKPCLGHLKGELLRGMNEKELSNWLVNIHAKALLKLFRLSWEKLSVTFSIYLKMRSLVVCKLTCINAQSRLFIVQMQVQLCVIYFIDHRGSQCSMHGCCHAKEFIREIIIVKFRWICDSKRCL